MEILCKVPRTYGGVGEAILKMAQLEQVPWETLLKQLPFTTDMRNRLKHDPNASIRMHTVRRTFRALQEKYPVKLDPDGMIVFSMAYVPTMELAPITVQIDDAEQLRIIRAHARKSNLFSPEEHVQRMITKEVKRLASLVDVPSKE